jgi:hypothetical protein
MNDTRRLEAWECCSYSRCFLFTCEEERQLTLWECCLLLDLHIVPWYTLGKSMNGGCPFVRLSHVHR